ncbi:pentatricopeptide repeat-containing protein At2g30780-like [Phoenix dactylifera]|uniref:Pentatricopeptide repeat-containing protein At2g30780-like n=1 Tax=Phoenix dactylifera TaxID=42345 RepID=A0A8B7BHI3_PHODC|nr:pentatricopeptide repeat-containing protein At2g30780-like [Phoenix dactylifera]
MASISGVLAVARRRFCRQTPTSSLTVAANSLLAKLLRESEPGIKIALDAEEESLTAQRDASFWQPLIAALLSSAPRKAQLVLEWKLDKLCGEGIRDWIPYSKLIYFCGKLGNIPFAMKVFTSMEAQGIRTNTCTFNALVTSCLSTGNVVTALSLFEIMERNENCKPDLATYNAFVSMYSKYGDGHNMVGWYLAGKKAGFSPNIQTYESVITGFIRLEKYDDADRFYKEMMSNEILPNLTILESKLEGLCKQKDMHGIKEFLKFVVDGGWELSEPMAEKLARMYKELGLVKEMEQLLGLIKPTLDVGVLSRIHCGMIRLYALSDSLDDMEYSVGRMLKAGMTFTCPEDVDAVISSYFRQQAFTRLDLFLDRIRCSYKLAKSTYDLLVSGYRKFDLHERLGLIVKDMKNVGYA